MPPATSQPTSSRSLSALAPTCAQHGARRGEGGSNQALGSETIIGDYGDKASLEQALDGVSTVLFLTPPGPDGWTQARDFLDIAKRNPKLRIADLGAESVGERPDAEHPATRSDRRRDPRSAEPVRRPSPAFFHAELALAARVDRTRGQIAMSMGDGRLGLVDTRDIADVATRVLLDSSWDFGTYEITGPESLTFAEMAATLTKVLRKVITYVPLPLAAVEPAAPLGRPDDARLQRGLRRELGRLHERARREDHRQEGAQLRHLRARGPDADAAVATSSYLDRRENRTHAHRSAHDARDRHHFFVARSHHPIGVWHCPPHFRPPARRHHAPHEPRRSW